MKVLGIITEYNPFHLGHKIHLQNSLNKSKADATICIMSGCFLQRGRPAIIDQWSRAKMALQVGVDLILQLPVVYSTRSAEYFAWAAVRSLEATKTVDYLSFGSESGNINSLKELGELLAKEPQQLSSLLQEKLKEGHSYPQARTKALTSYLKLKSSDFKVSPTKAEEIINNPNNILGLEYIKALINLNSSITPLTIKREGADYYSNKLNNIASGSAIRNRIKKNQQQNKPLIDQQIRQSLPNSTVEVLKNKFKDNLGPIFTNDFSQQLLTLLRRVDKNKLRNYENITGGLENRFKEAALKATSLQELINLIKTKRFTQTRIQRILIHLLLGLTKDQLTKFDTAYGPQYLRVLGFNQQGRQLLKLIKKKSNLPLITKVANHFKSKQTPRNLLQEMLEYDLLANDLYTLAYSNNKAKKGGVDFRQTPILNF
ncbi:putative nucleotidyltransferase [Halobacteroides halobius DSM 5150]|uniref:tRNA(Met) cytidine acetate ligase n=1 Tax=Halobacteroides halobius (strain ATCC 35273 / DSM 5150 / MD-1) TaxID=748449 RepID=L0KBB6_HALHC|nr:nucleotidyltransferase [Halobacteroides halobius]AGB41373.1 putative nucleotidyltransferase [Halobacteroides halobius DSM 5150]